MTKQTGTILIATTAVVVIAAGIAGIGYTVAQGDEPAPPAAAATTNPNEVECVNVQRAFTAWDGPYRLKTAEEFAKFNEVDAISEVKAQEEFLAAVSGYSDQPSKKLRVALAGLGVELGMLNINITIGGEVQPGQPEKTATAVENVHRDYAAWKTAICP